MKVDLSKNQLHVIKIFLNCLVLYLYKIFSQGMLQDTLGPAANRFKNQPTLQ